MPGAPLAPFFAAAKKEGPGPDPSYRKKYYANAAVMMAME